MPMLVADVALASRCYMLLLCSYSGIICDLLISARHAGVEASCTYPGLLVGNTSVLTSTYKDSYVTGDVIVYVCDAEIDGAFSIAYVNCLNDGDWTDPNRGCTGVYACVYERPVGVGAGGWGGLWLSLVAQRRVAHMSPLYISQSDRALFVIIPI